MSPAARRYERVTYRDEQSARRRSVTLEDPADREMTIADRKITMTIGQAVNSEGDSVLYDGNRICVIEACLITRREELEMDLHYGQLVPLGTAKVPVTGKADR